MCLLADMAHEYKSLIKEILCYRYLLNKIRNAMYSIKQAHKEIQETNRKPYIFQQKYKNWFLLKHNYMKQSSTHKRHGVI